LEATNFCRANTCPTGDRDQDYGGGLNIQVMQSNALVFNNCQLQAFAAEISSEADAQLVLNQVNAVVRKRTIL